MAAKVNAGDVTTTSMFNVFPEEVILPEWNSRFTEPPIESMIGMILEAGGVHTPIKARRVPPDKKLEIVDGRQRVKATRYINANLKEFPEFTEPLRIPVTIITANPEEAFAMSIRANSQTNPVSFIDDAHNVRTLKDKYKWDADRILALYGTNGKPKSPAWLDGMLAITQLSKAVQGKLHEASMSQAVALAVAKHPEGKHEEILTLAQQLADNNGNRKNAAGVAATTPAEVAAAGRAVGSTVTTKRGLKDIRGLFETFGHKDEPLHSRRFCEAMLKWMDGVVEDDEMEKAFKTRFRPPAA